MRRFGIIAPGRGAGTPTHGSPGARLRRAHRPERGRQPAPDHDVRGLPRRRGALRHRVPVRRRRRRVRLDHAAAGRPVERREGRRLDAPAADPRDEPAVPAARSTPRGASAAASGAEELMKVKIDALDITVLQGRRGRHRRSGPRTTASGSRPMRPRSSTSTPQRSPIFLAAAFDADAAAERGQQIGDGTPVHITIPTDNPWVPLRILALGKTGAGAGRGRRLPHDRPAPRRCCRRRPATTASASTTAPGRRRSLLDDLRSDRGMEWIPRVGVADEGRGRLVGGRLVLRPRDRRLRARTPRRASTPASSCRASAKSSTRRRRSPRASTRAGCCWRSSSRSSGSSGSTWRPGYRPGGQTR